MVKKSRASASSSASPLGSTIKESASQIWLAGLGAFAKAHEEGGKVFEALVKEGGMLQRHGRKVTTERVSEVGDRVTQAATEFSRQANDTWEKIEQVFEDRVARALKSLGVPSRREVDALRAELAAMHAAANAGKAPRKRAAAGAARKTAAKKTVDKAPAAKKTARKAAKKAAK